MRKFISLVATSAILLNSFYAPLSALAEELTPTPEPTPEASATSEATPTPEATIAPTEEPTSSPVPTETPADLATPTPEISPIPEEISTPAPTDQPIETQAPESNPTTTSPPESSAPVSTPTISPTFTPVVTDDNAELSTQVIITELIPESLQENSVIKLITDKLDYTPTEIAIISGSGFIPEKVYSLTVSSTDDPATSTTVDITMNGKGEFTYEYQLDGNYRPNYLVEVKNGEELVASTTFTDADSGFLSPTSNTNNNGVSNPDRAYTSNNAYAVFDSSSDRVDYTNFGLSIPSGSTINGIEVYLEGNRDSLRTWDISLSYDAGSHWAPTSKNAGASFGSTDSNITLGGSADTWGRVWSYENFTNSNFRVRVDATSNPGSTGDVINLDLIQVKVTYTPFVNTSPIITEGDSTNVIISKNGTPTPFALTLHATDVDAGQTLTWSIFSAASHGVASVSGTGNSKSITYTPNTNYVGNDSFIVQVSDGNGGIDNITVNVTVQETDIVNPALSQSCGIDVVLVVDTSTSIDNSELSTMKTALKSFVNTFVGTPTQMAIVSFDDSAVLQSNWTNNLSALTATGGVIDNIDGSGYTNWEDALNDSRNLFPNRAGVPDLIVFTSDGNPTTSNGPLSDLQDAVTQANLAKGNGIRIITLGIGSDVNQSNLVAISSSDAYYSAATFNDLESQLHNLVVALCGGTITVRKSVTGENNPTLSGWHFTVDGHDYATDSDGYTQSIPVSPGTYSVVEVGQNGYTLDTKSCVKNGNQSVGSSITNGVGSISVSASDIISCTFVNSKDPFCGDGVVNQGSEQCDDGNSVNNDSCTNQCMTAICGDGILQNSIGEQCDAGADNEMSCTPSYGGQCSFCNATTCQNETITGPYCGDGIVNGAEQCDDANSVDSDSCSNLCTRNNGSIKIIKDSQPDSSQSFHFTYANNAYPIGDFDLKDDGVNQNFIEFTSIPSGVYSWSENQTQGWTITALSCSESSSQNSSTNLSSGTANIMLDSGESVVCTFTNTRDTGSVKVNKMVDIDGNGIWMGPEETSNSYANSHGFSWILDGGVKSFGTQINSISTTIPTESHTFSENMPSGYHFSGWYNPRETGKSCTNPNGTSMPNTIQVNKGQTTEITLCNSRDTGTITVIKNAIKNSEDNFRFDVSSNFPGGSFELEDDGYPGNGGTPEQRTFTVPAGNYWIDERDMSGWKLTDLSCSSDSVRVNVGSGRVDMAIGKGENITCTFTNTELAKISGFKFEDENTNGNWDLGYPSFEHALGNWRIFIDSNNNGNYDNGEQYSWTNNWIFYIPFWTGHYEFNNLLPGTYTICEDMKPDWTNVTPVCRSVDLRPGEETNVNFGNVKYGSVTVTKFDDINQNGTFDDGEKTLSGWTINLDRNSQVTGESGTTKFVNILTGTHSLSENLKEGWLQTGIYCDKADVPDIEVKAQEGSSNGYSVYVSAGKNVNCYIGNVEEINNLEIAKSNDSVGTVGAGSTITYSLTLTNNGNTFVSGIAITDVLPGGFTYIAGSTTGATTDDPVISGSVLTWQFSHLAAGESITINYKAQAASDVSDGTYVNYATCVAASRLEKDLACDHAESSVLIGTGVSYGGNLTGQVLGASTSILPATGNPTWLLAIALTLIGGGLALNVYTRKDKKYAKK